MDVDVKLPVEKFALTFIWRCRECKSEAKWPLDSLNCSSGWGVSDCPRCNLELKIKRGGEPVLDYLCSGCRMKGSVD
jgi:hypothetical protein